jgi:hypothetical protein
VPPRPAHRLLLTLLWLPALCAGADATDPCAQFSWNVQRERALFASSPQTLSAATSESQAPALTQDLLYELTLHPQADVQFATPPGKQRPASAPQAGLASLTLARAGRYRIALDQPLWVDVVSAGTPIRSSDFQGQPGCSAPHKIVEFELPAHQRLLLQLSGGTSAHLRMTVTRAPAPP